MRSKVRRPCTYRAENSRYWYQQYRLYPGSIRRAPWHIYAVDKSWKKIEYRRRRYLGSKRLLDRGLQDPSGGLAAASVSPFTRLHTTMPKSTVIKSAKTGRFVSKRQEKRSPSTTYRQTVKRSRKK